MKLKTLLALGVAFMLGASALVAQTPGASPTSPPLPVAIGEVAGTVLVNGSTTPVPRASITIRNKATGALAAGAMAADNGSFRIQGLRPGTYYLRATSIGFAPKNTAVFTITPASPSVALGIIGLSQVAIELQSVAVTTDRSTMTIEPDRNTYSAKQVAPTATNASEILDAVPSVQVDGDGKVSYRGNENVAVQINGRPSPISGVQLAAYLKSLPATIVERIEVIPNPSAKYDPEGMAGIINIVLKQSTDLGLSGGLTAGGASVDRYNASGNLGYQKGQLTLFNSLGLNADGRTISGADNRERLPATSVPQSFTDQLVSSPTTNRGQNWTSNADYKLNSRDVLSNSLSLNHRGTNDASEINYREMNSTGALFDRYDRLRHHTANGFTVDNSLSFKRTLTPRKHEITTELRFNRSQERDRTDIWRQPLTLSGTIAGNQLEGQNDDSKSGTSQLTAQLDYTRTLAPRTKLETGFKGYGRWLDRDYTVLKDALGTGAWVRSNLSNTFAFDENVQAVYGVLSHGVGKFELQGGLRADYAGRNFSLANPAQKYPHTYGSLFPSGVISYNKSDATQMKLSYSRRIRRPGTQELNPFPVFFDVQNVFIGNPRLSPEYTDAIEAGISRTGEMGSVQLSPFFRHTSNIIRVVINTADKIDGREVTSVSFQNLKSANSFGTDLNGSLKLGKKFTGFGSFNVYKMVTDGGSASSLSSNAVTWSSRVSGTMQFTPATTVQASYFYRGPVVVERGRFWAFHSANLSLRQKFNAASTVSIRVVDPFNTQRFRIRAGDETVIQLTDRRFDARAVYVTYQYNFGQVPKFRQPRQEAPEPQAGFPPP